MSALIRLTAVPTLITMFISGVWHGAGYTYVLWGLMHGAYITINHAWRQLRPRVWPGSKNHELFLSLSGRLLTFLAVVFGIVMFRAPTVHGAVGVWADMLGAHGTTLPGGVLARLGSVGHWLVAIGVRPDTASGAILTEAMLRISVLLAVVLWMPNTLQMLAPYQPAIGVKPARQETWLVRHLRWTQSRSWAVGMAAVAAASILSLGQLSEFLYWQF